MDIFKEMEKEGVEQIVFTYDKASGLKAITAIHDTTMGPALGGCRMYDYEKTDDAIIDAIRLALGMTYKCSGAGANFGGGKSVILGDPKEDKNEMLMRAFGRSVESLNGRYYSGTDVGTTGMDFVYASQETEYLVGLPEEYGGGGNTAVPTAYGIYMGIKAGLKTVYGDDSLKGKKFALQGLGKVGRLLVDYLIRDGGQVIISNKSQEPIEELRKEYPQIESVGIEDIYGVEADVFIPCAMGGIINDETISKFKCKIIAGSANNQLAEERHGQALKDKGILYAPDFIINAGGLIQAADEVGMKDLNHDRVMNKCESIYHTLLKIFEISKEKDIPSNEAAIKMAKERIETVGQIKRRYIRP